MVPLYMVHMNLFWEVLNIIYNTLHIPLLNYVCPWNPHSLAFVFVFVFAFHLDWCLVVRTQDFPLLRQCRRPRITSPPDGPLQTSISMSSRYSRKKRQNANKEHTNTNTVFSRSLALARRQMDQMDHQTASAHLTIFRCADISLSWTVRERFFPCGGHSKRFPRGRAWSCPMRSSEK